MPDAIIFMIGCGLIVMALALCAWWVERQETNDE